MQIKITEYKNNLIELKSFEYNALKAQVNPHFLFNTLDVIKYLINTNKEDAIECIVDLSLFYRKSLNQTDDFHMLLNELKVVKLYVEIQKKRFGERLEVDLKLDDNVYKILFPIFVLQTIVENSIRHGMGNSKEKLNVIIEAKRIQGYLYVEVSDSGVGFSDIALDAIYKDANSENIGIGLRNANRRLELLYGSDYILEINNKERGASVIIRIPVKEIS